MEKKGVQEFVELITSVPQWKEGHTVFHKLLFNISNETELDVLANRINIELKSILNVDHCLVLFPDSSKKELWTKVIGGSAEEIRLSTDDSIIGKVLQTGKVSFINGNQKDAPLLKDYSKKIKYDVKSILSCPLHDKSGKIVAILQGLNKKENSFNAKDIELLLAIEPLLSSTIVNVYVHKETKKALTSFIDAIANALDMRDYIMSGHSRRVMLYALEIGRKIKLNAKQMEILKFAALLHDIGKIGVPEVVLFKDRRLSEEEYNIMKQHASLTKSILMGIHFTEDLKTIPQIAAAHHEKLDGTGYPEGLKGDQIPLESRILMLVDVFDALTSRRKYHDRVPLEDVLKTLDQETGSSFDPFIVYNFKLIELSRLLLILEYGHNDKISENDLKKLQGYHLKELIEIREKVKKSDQEIEIENIFMGYYLRRN